jgi:hypothetical protein
MAEMDRFDDDYFTPDDHHEAKGEGGKDKFDANKQLAYAIERIGPMVLAMKKKFDQYCDDGSARLSEQKAIGMFHFLRLFPLFAIYTQEFISH